MKLTERDVKAMNMLKEMGYTQTAIAKMFGVSQRIVSYHCSPESKKWTKFYNKRYKKYKALRESVKIS